MTKNELKKARQAAAVAIACSPTRLKRVKREFDNAAEKIAYKNTVEYYTVYNDNYYFIAVSFIAGEPVIFSDVTPA